jgi:ABC-type sugar transport system ATPase subunit
VSGAALLELEGIEKGFFGVRVLKGVDLSLGAGRVLGLVGENGAGKSTLVNVLGGVLAADAGRMRLGGAPYAPASPSAAKARGVAFVHQELNLFPNLTVAENLLLHALPRRGAFVDRRALASRAARLLGEVGLGVPPGTPLERLAPGERQLVEIAKALAADASVVILDEPTTSLTAPEVERLFGILDRLRTQGRGIVYISHALGDVLRVADDVLVLRDGAVVGRGAKAEFDEARLVSLMVGRAIETVFPQRRGHPRGEVALAVEGAGGPRFRGVGLELHHGEVLGLYGLMGAGRTELVRALFGLEPLDAGTVTVGGRALGRSPRAAIARGLALVTEDRRHDGLVMDAAVGENLALVALPSLASAAGLLTPHRVASAVRAQAEAVRLESATGLAAPARSLSGGNQQKVVLGKWLMARPGVFVLDEPTRGIDVGAKQQVYRLVAGLADSGAAVLVVSSEIEELLGLCDNLLVMRRGEIVARLARPFDREAVLRAALGTAAGGSVSGEAAAPGVAV